MEKIDENDTVQIKDLMEFLLSVGNRNFVTENYSWSSQEIKSDMIGEEKCKFKKGIHIFLFKENNDEDNISKETLKDMDDSVSNYKNNKISEPIDLKDFTDSEDMEE